MNLTNSQYNQLMYQYSESQANSIAELDKRREEVYKALPELKDLEAEVRSLSLTYVRNSSSNDEEASKNYHQKMDELKLRRSKLLIKNGWTEDYLEQTYDCPDCKDTGYINGERCHCMKKKAIELFYRQSNLDRILNRENFDTFDLSLYPDDLVDPVTGMTSKDIMKEAKDLAVDFTKTFDTDFRNLLLYGDTGVGKTFLSHCIAKELLNSGHSVLYMDAISLFGLLEARQFDKEMNYGEKNAMLSYIIDAELLIIDDLGTELTNGFTTTQLYHVIEGRLMDQHSTIISTNLSIKELNDLYTERVFSRIMSNYENLRLVGDDIRLKKF
ncbi:MAG: ATP-binding protein [Eubacterium sp.]|nr:ATP-binding protein [Eubacterium sp.]